jgi:hypothetical protein
MQVAHDVPEFYKPSGQCLYTSQGDIVCTRSTQSSIVERFGIDEPPVIPPPSPIAKQPDIVESALQSQYCKISVKKDPATGEVTYDLAKNC